MERRVFLTGLLGVAGAATLAATLPRQAQALTIGPLDDPTPASGGILPELQAEEAEATEEGVEVAQYGGPRRRGRRYGRRSYRRGRRYAYAAAGYAVGAVCAGAIATVGGIGLAPAAAAPIGSGSDGDPLPVLKGSGA